jgi:predicted RNase H-like HicB family nuclease
MKVKYAVLFEQAESNWAAYVPDLPGCMTTDKTLEETEINIREAIEGHLRTLRDFGDSVPQPTSVAKEVEISPAASHHWGLNPSLSFRSPSRPFGQLEGGRKNEAIRGFALPVAQAVLQSPNRPKPNSPFQ